MADRGADPAPLLTLWEERWWPARLKVCILILFNFWLGFADKIDLCGKTALFIWTPQRWSVGKIFSCWALTFDCTAVEPRSRVRGINVDYNPGLSRLDTLWLADSCKYGHLQQHGFLNYNFLPTFNHCTAPEASVEDKEKSKAIMFSIYCRTLATCWPYSDPCEKKTYGVMPVLPMDSGWWVVVSLILVGGQEKSQAIKRFSKIAGNQSITTQIYPYFSSTFYL